MHLPSHPAIGRTFIARFASNDLHGLEYKGEPCVLAFEQADAMGAERGNFTDHIRRLADAGEMIDGEHRHVVTDPAEMRALRAAYRLPDNLSASGVIADRTPNVVLLTRQGAILAAMTSRAPHAREFRAWAVEVLYNVLTTGAHVEPGATAEAKPLPPVAQGLIPIEKSREIRLYSASMKRAGRPIEEIANYQRREESALGLAFLGRGVPSSIHTQPTPPLLPAPALKPTDEWPRLIRAARAVPLEALRAWATGREPFTTQDALVGVLGVPEASIRQPAVQWFNVALREIGCFQARVRGQRRRWVLGVPDAHQPAPTTCDVGWCTIQAGDRRVPAAPTVPTIRAGVKKKNGSH